jgi:hypothetical protein
MRIFLCLFILFFVLKLFIASGVVLTTLKFIPFLYGEGGGIRTKLVKLGTATFPRRNSGPQGLFQPFNEKGQNIYF